MASGHLRRRAGIYWFRRRVPDTLIERIGRREIHRSLRTTSLSEAAARAKRAWLETETLFTGMTRNPSLTAEQAAIFLRRLVHEPLHRSPTADDLVQAFTGGETAYTKLFFNEVAADLIMALPAEQRAHIHAHMQTIADRLELHVARLAQEVNQRKAEAAISRAEAAEAMLHEADDALAEVVVEQEVVLRLKEIAAANARSPAPPPATVEETPGTAPAPAKVRGKTKALRFSEVEPNFINDKRRAHGYSGQTVAQVRATFRLWLDLIGDKPVDQYDGADAGRFRDLILRLPASHGKGGRVHAMDAIRAADRRETGEQEPVPRLSMKTAKRHFSALSQLWEWLRPREHVERNIFRGFSFPGTKSTRRLRDDWADEDLIKLFSSKWFAADINRDAGQRWVPLIAMFSGLRLEEICRLRPVHDIDIEDIPAFKVQEHPEPEPWNPKSEAGERVVPVHPVLIELGLLNLVARRRTEGAARLFPEFRPTGPDAKYSTEFSRKFGKLKDSIGVPKKVVFHSFRHSVRTVLGNTEIKDSWIDAVLGHEGEDGFVGIAVYLKRIGIANLRTTVDAIAYSDEVMKAVRGIASVETESDFTIARDEK